MNEVILHHKLNDANQLNRPKAQDILHDLHKWQYDESIELQAQIIEADEINNSSNKNISSTSLGIYQTHSEAIYTSRLLSFNNLPEPKNSDDYYEQNDNIISNEFSESLQIDISQLNNNKMPKIKNSDEQYDNIISKESSESLQIDIYQLSNNKMPKIKNSDEQCDNIISQESSESLQIDISQLNNN
ncbi:kinase-like domain-containing protein [Rhizophagus irregularis DAOM 181602=DAOM 197198]|nr:kinase-like domain-containing protein [Rhizophagus irregularis DAOM 181602=DAOM 197198]